MALLATSPNIVSLSSARGQITRAKVAGWVQDVLQRHLDRATPLDEAADLAVYLRDHPELETRFRGCQDQTLVSIGMEIEDELLIDILDADDALPATNVGRLIDYAYGALIFSLKALP